jgi:hypothetical protein
LNTIDPVIGDSLLTARRGQPVDKLPTEILFDMQVFRWVHQHDTVSIKKPPITFDDYL